MNRCELKNHTPLKLLMSAAEPYNLFIKDKPLLSFPITAIGLIKIKFLLGAKGGPKRQLTNPIDLIFASFLIFRPAIGIALLYWRYLA